MLLLVSSVVGAVVGIAILVVQKKGRNTAIAFGPYLAIAGLITLFSAAGYKRLSSDDDGDAPIRGWAHRWHRLRQIERGCALCADGCVRH